MTQAGTAFVDLKFNPASMAAAEGETAGLGGRMMSTFKRVAVAFAAIFAVQKGFDFLKSALGEAAATQKYTEGIRAGYGKASDAVLKFSDTAASAFGISKQASEEFSASLAITGKNIGLSHAQTATMATGFQKVAGSLGLIKGIDPATVFDKLKLAMLGNTRGLKSLGISADSTSQKHEALILGIKGSSSDWTAAQKAQIIYGIATKHLGGFMSEAKKHSGDLQDSQRKLSAEWANAKEQLGAKLLPVAQRFASWLLKEAPTALKYAKEGFHLLGVAIAAVKPYVMDVVDFIVANFPKVRSAIQSAIGWVTNVAVPAFIRTWKDIKPQVMPTLTAVWTLIKTVFGKIKSTVITIAHGIQSFWHNWGKTILSVAKTAWNTLKDVVKSALQILRGVIEIATGLISGDWGKVWTGIKDVVKGAWHGIVAIVKGLAQSLWTILRDAGAKMISGFVDGIKSKFDSVKNTLGGLTSKLTSWKGPPERDRRILTPSGEMVIQGFIAGIDKQAPNVRQSLQRVTNHLASGGYSAALVSAGGGGAPSIRIFVGDREIKDIVRVEVDSSNRRTGQQLRAGRKWATR